MSKLEQQGGAAHVARRHQPPRRTDGGPRAGTHPVSKVGPIGRLGRYTATHFRAVLVGWLLVALVLGFFAPRVENALSGRGLAGDGLAVRAGASAD